MWKILLIVIIILGVLLLLECRRELRMFCTVRYHVRSERLQGLRGNLKLVFLSDLHNYVYGNKNDTLLQAVKRAAPDLIVITGDMLVGKKEVSWEPAFQFVSRLPEIAPVYYSLGNHEQRMEQKPEIYGTGFKQFKEGLEACNVQFLDNKSQSLIFGDCRIDISGLTIPNEFYEKFRKKSYQSRQVEECLGKHDEGAYQILLAHHPGYFEAYKSWGADLTLSGHLHGGIVRIPGFRGVITPQAFLFPKHSGEMTVEGNAVIIVSKGLGVHTIPLRLFNPAELIVVSLEGAEAE